MHRCAPPLRVRRCIYHGMVVYCVLEQSMSRAFNGQIHVRVPANIHEEVAKEAFDKGTSISGILAQALIVRRALRNVDPWKSIEEVQSANRGVSAAEVENAVAKAVKAVRKARREPDVKKASN